MSQSILFEAAPNGRKLDWNPDYTNKTQNNNLIQFPLCSIRDAIDYLLIPTAISYFCYTYQSFHSHTVFAENFK